MTEGQKLGETHKKLCKEKFWIREHKVCPDIIFYIIFICVMCDVLCVKPKILWQPPVQGTAGCWQLSWPAAWLWVLQVPRTSELYVHRSGRTARAANEGLSLLLIGPEDLINFRKIYKTLEKSEELPFFPVDAKCMTSIKVKK